MLRLSLDLWERREIAAISLKIGCLWHKRELSLICVMCVKTVAGRWVNALVLCCFNVNACVYLMGAGRVSEENQFFLTTYSHTWQFSTTWLMQTRCFCAGLFHHAFLSCQRGKAKGKGNDYSDTNTSNSDGN